MPVFFFFFFFFLSFWDAQEALKEAKWPMDYFLQLAAIVFKVAWNTDI